MTNRILGLEPYSDSVSYIAAQEWLRLKSVFFFCGIAPVLQVVRRAYCVSSDDLKPHVSTELSDILGRRHTGLLKPVTQPPYEGLTSTNHALW
ncbi:hypothetical protein PGT21_023023 [Puccinia graminis f. sp. tritici]|uniref:Uncharacterized protein n=1 Tax=Puccinia graminis f. sp. tritici TaxID=56615 RepID=A0A5B0Q6K0_PUCGR|nr:hypothetical protein PGT21_023023 [Puccinia graminis f. sp. tritici]